MTAAERKMYIMFRMTHHISNIEKEKWWDEEILDEKLFDEVEKCATFYVTHYQKERDESMDPEYVIHAWMSEVMEISLSFTGWLFLQLNQHVAGIIRKHIGGYTRCDYEQWANIEDILQEEVTDMEFEELQNKLADNKYLGEICCQTPEDIERLRNLLLDIRKKKNFAITMTRHLCYSITQEIEASTEEEAREIFKKRLDAGEFDPMLEEASYYAEVYDETTDIKEEK